MPGVYETWFECSAQVTGFPGAEFKGFETRGGALAYIGGAQPQIQQQQQQPLQQPQPQQQHQQPQHQPQEAQNPSPTAGKKDSLHGPEGNYEEQYPRLEMYGPAAKGREPPKGPVRVEATSVYLVQPLLR